MNWAEVCLRDVGTYLLFCAGTSHVDGLSIAFAMSEFLLKKTAYTLFVTHYKGTLQDGPPMACLGKKS